MRVGQSGVVIGLLGTGLGGGGGGAADRQSHYSQGRQSKPSPRPGLPPLSRQLSAVSCQLPADSCPLSAVSCHLSAVSPVPTCLVSEEDTGR